MLTKVIDKFEQKIFIDRELTNKEGKSLPIDETIVNKIYRDFMKNDYIDENDNITHKLKEIKESSDVCTIIRRGQYIDTVNVKEVNEDELATMMVGHSVKLVVDKTQ